MAPPKYVKSFGELQSLMESAQIAGDLMLRFRELAENTDHQAVMVAAVAERTQQADKALCRAGISFVGPLESQANLIGQLVAATLNDAMKDHVAQCASNTSCGERVRQIIDIVVGAAADELADDLPLRELRRRLELEVPDA